VANSDGWEASDGSDSGRRRPVKDNNAFGICRERKRKKIE